MYCDNCGCELGENVRKCPVCGKEFPLIEPEVDDSTTVLTSEPDVDEDDDSTTVLTGGTQGMPQMMQQPQGNPVPPQQPQMGMPQPQIMPQEGADIMIKKKGEKKGMSKGEFNSVAQVNGGLENMINWEGKDKDLLALIKYIAEEDKLEKVLENPQVIKTPVVRNGKQSTLGYQPDIWKVWK